MTLDEEAGQRVEWIVGRLKPHQTVTVEGSRDTITRDTGVNARVFEHDTCLEGRASSLLSHSSFPPFQLSYRSPFASSSFSPPFLRDVSSWLGYAVEINLLTC